MAGSILNNYLEDPPEPGSNHPIEHIRASFTLSSSVASVAHSFTASFSSAPQIVHGPPNKAVELWVASNSASGATFHAKTLHNAQTASNAGSIVVDYEAKPDLS